VTVKFHDGSVEIIIYYTGEEFLKQIIREKETGGYPSIKTGEIFFKKLGFM
jgi:hypothetical protein